MKTNDNAKAVTNTAYQRSYFDWGSNMQVIQKGKGEISMKEGELARFFGVTWKKLNHRLQIIMKSSDLHPDERGASGEDIYANEQLKRLCTALSASNNHCPLLSVRQHGSPFV